MIFQAYLNFANLSNFVIADLDLPDNALDLPSDELRSVSHDAVMKHLPKSSYKVLSDVIVSGIREKVDLGPLPTPAWLLDEHTKTIFPGHHRLMGNLHSYHWSLFFQSLFSHLWKLPGPWLVNSNGQGFPQSMLDVAQQKSIPFGGKTIPLEDLIPTPWLFNMQHRRVPLGLFPPSICENNMHNFVEFTPQACNLLPARTHPAFYIALYEFWMYLHKQPIWAHVHSQMMVDSNRIASDFSFEQHMSIGLACSTFRWGWWSLLNNIFAPSSRALAILQQYYPDCQVNGYISPRPTNLEMDATLVSPVPRLRVLQSVYF